MGEKIPAHSEETGDELTSSVYPNPFNPSTNITFTLPEEGRVHIEIFDVLGRKVITLVDEYHQQGSFTVLWNGQNKNGYTVASGIFFCVIAYNDQVITKKMVMMR